MEAKLFFDGSLYMLPNDKYSKFNEFIGLNRLELCIGFGLVWRDTKQQFQFSVYLGHTGLEEDKDYRTYSTSTELGLALDAYIKKIQGKKLVYHHNGLYGTKIMLIQVPYDLLTI